MPLREAASEAFLEEVLQADAPALENMFLLLTSQPSYGARKAELRELLDLASFRKNGERASQADTKADELEKSHLFLLWLWALEEKTLGLAPLEDNCALLNERLLNTLFEDTESWIIPKARKTSWDPAFLPDWRTVLLHLLPFAPAPMPLLLDGAMRDELKETMTWLPLNEVAPHLEARYSGKFLGMYATPAEICGNRRVFNSGLAVDKARLWLILEEQ